MSSGLPLKADIAGCGRHAAKVPKKVVGVGEELLDACFPKADYLSGWSFGLPMAKQPRLQK
jgi:hypothetical protein